MRVKNRKTGAFLLLMGCALVGYWVWLSVRPVDIIAIHHRSSGFSDVLVTNFPLTNKGKINWWLKNRGMLKAKYGVPKPDSGDYFYVTFWYFGEGYKEEGKYDRLCFDDIKAKVNCIDKNRVFSAETGRDGDIIFTVTDAVYRMKKDGKISPY